MTDLREKTRKDWEKAERKRFDSIWWAGVLIWIGLVLGAEALDILPEIGDNPTLWPWIFAGVGPWSLGLNLYLLNSRWPDPTTWDWVWTGIFLVLAAGTFVEIGGEMLGAFLLVGIGVAWLIREITQREHPPGNEGIR